MVKIMKIKDTKWKINEDGLIFTNSISVSSALKINHVDLKKYLKLIEDNVDNNQYYVRSISIDGSVVFYEMTMDGFNVLVSLIKEKITEESIDYMIDSYNELIDLLNRKAKIDAIIGEYDDQVNIPLSYALNHVSKINGDDDVNYIYLMHCKSTGLTKIGRSKNPSSRLKSISTHSPTGINIIFTHKAEKSKEHDLHVMMKHKRLHGEWFNLSKEDIQRIKDSF